MASEGVSGWTAEEVQERREEFEERHADDDKEFEDTYCLAKIPVQPDDYDGPQRYCGNPRTIPMGDAQVCKHHGGASDGKYFEREKPQMKHGLYAARDNLVDDFDDKDEALYDWIVDTYPEAYDIEVETDPASAYDLHRLAAEIVRAERGRGFLLSEGEVKEQKVRDDEGKIVLDEEGNVVTEKSEHYLAQMMHRQDKKITKLEKELGITRKEQQRQDSTDDAVDAIKSFSEVGKAIVNKNEKKYDPDEEAWSTDENDSGDS